MSARSISIPACCSDRIIFLGTPIDDQIANVIIAQMLFLAHEDPDQDIRLYINSPGGVVYSGLAIYDTMQMIKPDVATFCMGMGASMAAVLLAAGTPGQAIRPAERPGHDPPGLGRFPRHGPGYRGGGPRDPQPHDQAHRDPGPAHRSADFDKVKRDTERDYYMTAQEAKEYGIVDEVLEPAHKVAEASSNGSSNGNSKKK